MNETATYVSIEEVMRYASLKALANEARQHDQMAIIDIVCGRIAHGYDIHPEDIEVASVDISMAEPYLWGVDLVWWVPCDECEMEAVIGETTKFTAPMCRVHLDEAYEQDLADQHNDDVALGLA